MRPAALVALTYIGFISLGLPDGMLGVAWPSMRREFALSLDAIGAVLIVFTAGYLLSSSTSGYVLGRLGVGNLLAVSTLISGLALLGYAASPLWTLVVGLSLFGGIGAGAIDTGLNTHAALFYSPRTVTWLHASYGLGAAAGPWILSAILQAGATWRAGYLTIGVAVTALGIGFAATRRQWPAASRPNDPSARASVPPWQTLRMPAVWTGILTFFLYTGLEAAVGTWTFTYLTGHHRLDTAPAGAAAGAYWMALALGRVLAGVAAAHMSVNRLLGLAAFLVLAGACLVPVASAPPLAICGILVVGFGLAPIFPLLISRTPGRVGTRHVANTVGFQISAAIIGLSAIPAIVGILGRMYGLESIPRAWLLAAILLAVLMWMGTRPRATSPAAGPPSPAENPRHP